MTGELDKITQVQTKDFFTERTNVAKLDKQKKTKTKTV